MNGIPRKPGASAGFTIPKATRSSSGNPRPKRKIILFCAKSLGRHGSALLYSRHDFSREFGMARRKIAVIGVGKIAQDQHLPVIDASPDFELAATVSTRGIGHGDVPVF